MGIIESWAIFKRWVNKTFLNKNGDFLNTNLFMGNYSIKNIPSPVDDSNLINKQYADEQISSFFSDK